MKTLTRWRNKLWKAVAFLFLILSLGMNGWGQVTLPHYDGLDYTDAASLQTQTGWTVLNTGDNLLISAGSLSYTGLIASTGNKVTFDGSGIDAAKLFTQQTTGTVYYSFLLNVTSLGSLGTTGGYFTGLNEGTSTNYGSTIWTKSDGAGGYLIGLNPRTTAANTIWSTSKALNTTYFIVISYEIVSGSANDVVKMWINPIPGSSEPVATLSATNAGTDLTNVNRILIRQDNSTNTPFIQMDELRIGKTWADVTPTPDLTAPTFTATYPSASSITSSSFTLNVNLDEISKAYYVVLANGAGTPSAAQVKAGTDDSDAPALKSGSIDVLAATTEYPASISGLAFATDYDVYVVAEDDESTPNLQATSDLVDVTTLAASSAKQILTYSLPGQAASATINDLGASGTITVEMPETADLSNLAAIFTISDGASVAIGGTSQESTVTTNDFSSAKVYTVTAEDLSTKNWTVSTFSHPDLTADGAATVDNNIVITFNDNSTWRTAISAVKVDGNALTLTTDYTIAAGELTLIPSGGNINLQTPGNKAIVVEANGYSNATVSQVINIGAFNITTSTVGIDDDLELSQTRTITLTAKDKYNNLIENYIAKFDVTITDAGGVDESYNIKGVDYTSSAANIAMTATNASGVSSFNVIMPGAVDGDDGISIQIKLNDDVTTIGSPYSYTGSWSPALTASGSLTELNLDGAYITLTLQHETFDDATLDQANFTLDNAPSGVTVSGVTYNSTTSATITLAYDGTDFDVTVTNMSVIVNNAELTGPNPLTSNTISVAAIVETEPTVSTNTNITTIGYTTAKWGGDVSADGGESVTEKGICWSTSTNPTTSDSKTTEGGGTGAITGSMDGLTVNTTYYVKAYATNSINTAYGDEKSFKTLTPSVSSVEITEVSPYYAGDEVTVTWASTGVTYVKIELYDGTAYSDLIASTTSDGTEQVTIPSASSYGTAYKVRVSDVSNALYQAESAAFTIIPVATSIANLKTFSDGSVVKIGTEVIVSFVRTNRNQKYIQDGTGGILIDDPNPAKITSTYIANDGMTGLVGTLTTYNGYREIIPISDPGTPTSTGNIITPIIFTLDEISKLTNEYESMLVKLVNVNFTTTGSFAASTSYTLTDGTNSIVYRTLLAAESDIDGSPIPANKVTVTGIATEYSAVGQMYATILSGIQSAVATISSTVYTVNNTDNTITAVPYAAGLTSFSENITAATGATFLVYKSDGTTLADTILTGYKVIVTAEDEINTKTYTITKNAASDLKDILAFSLDGYTGTISGQDITINIPYTEDETNMVATFTLSPYAHAFIGVAPQVSGATVNSFASAITYTIKAQNESTKNWTVNVIKAGVPLQETKIITYSINGVDGLIDETGHTVAVSLPYGTSVTALVANFSLSTGAKAKVGGILQVSGITANDFTNTVIYVVTAEDNTTIQNWTVTISISPASNDATLTSTEYLVNNAAGKIKNVPYGTSLATFISNLTAADGASFQVYQSDSVTVATVLETGCVVIVTAQDVTITNIYTVTISPSANTADIFFSEYIEGSGNNKALEIYNGTGSDVDLHNYIIRINSNGGAWTTYFDFPLGTILSNNDVYVIAHSKANASILAVTDSIVTDPYAGGTSYVATFNGNDVRGLFKVTGADTTIIDIIGAYDMINPGTGWTVAGFANATANKTLVRKASVSQGNTNWTASAGTNTDNSEWNVNAQDDFSFIGSHNNTSSTVDITAPEVTFYPVDESTTIGIDVNPTITFNEVVYKADGNDFTEGEDVSALVKMFETATPANVVTIAATISDKVITIVPADDLTNNMQYSFAVKEHSFEDFAENEVKADTAKFTTIAAGVGTISNVSVSTTAPYYAGDAITVIWTSTNITNVKIELYDGSAYSELIASTESDGSQEVTLPVSLSYNINYKIRVSDAGNEAVNSESAVLAVRAVAAQLSDLLNMSANEIVKYTGKATVTYARTAYNQKYIQDVSGAILIHDATTAPGYITEAFAIGEGITNIVGKISIYYGLVELVPIETTGEKTTGNPEIIPEVRTLASLVKVDQCKLVKIQDVTFSGTGNFAASTNYTITDGTTTDTVCQFRDGFAEADYIGTPVPTQPVSFVSLVGMYKKNAFSQTVMQVTARNLADFIIPASNDATLSDLTIDGNTVADFDAATYTYDVELAYGTTDIPVVAATTNDANANAVVTQATELPGSATVVVTAEDGATELTYTINFTVALNNVATLADLKFDGTTIDGFDAATLIYNVILPVETSEVPVVTATTTDANAELFISEATVVPGTTKVKVIAENGIVSLIYEVRFTFEGLSNDASLADLSVDGETVAGFAADVYSYSIELPFGTSVIPEVAATASEPNAEVNVTQAAELPGIATIVVNAQDGVTSLTYEVEFTIAPSNIATLSNIMVDGDDLVGFSPDQLVYVYVLAAETTVAPAVYAQATDNNATVVVTDASTIPGITSIKVIAENEIDSLIYEIRFTVDGLSNDASLSDLKVDDVTVSGFDSAVYEYTIVLPYGTTDIPVVSATKNVDAANMVITQAAGLPGNATVHVIAEDEVTELTYTIHFELAPNDDATLSDLVVNGLTITGFAANVLSYNIELPAATTDIPVIDATASDENAEIIVTQATSLPGSASVLVTAEDGETTLTYTVNFAVEQIHYYSVTFAVKDQDNNAVEGASIVFISQTLTTDINGTVVFEQVSPVNMAAYTVSKTDYITYESTVTVTDANVSVDVVLEYNDVSDRNTLLTSVYPNPAKDVLNISLSKMVDNCQLIITDLQGKVIKNEGLNETNKLIDISILTQGIYMVTIKSDEGISVHKIVVE